MGGMKKKFQIKALNNADSITGKISNKIALRETTNNRISDTALKPIMSTDKKQKIAVTMTSNTLIRYCLFLL